LLIAPSLDIVGGQAVQASRLLELLRNAPGIEIEFLPMNPKPPFRWIRKIKYLRTVIVFVTFLGKLLAKAGCFDILHVFSAANYSFLLSAAPVVVVGRLYGRKSIVNYRDGRASQHLATWKSSRLLRLADQIVTPSEYLVGVFAQFGYQAQSIYNIIDLEKFHYRRRKPVRPVFLHNRGLEELYNIPCSLKAFGLVQQRYPEACLTMAHDGPLRAELEHKVKHWGLRNVRFLGTVPHHEIAALYDAADIYLTSPNIDNMPGSLLECYASGLPVVATNAGGIPFIAKNEETALLVDTNDHEGMAQAALRLIEEDGLADRLATRARKQCQRYSGPAVRDAWLALYRKMRPL